MCPGTNGRPRGQPRWCPGTKNPAGRRAAVGLVPPLPGGREAGPFFCARARCAARPGARRPCPRRPRAACPCCPGSGPWSPGTKSRRTRKREREKGVREDLSFQNKKDNGQEQRAAGSVPPVGPPRPVMVWGTAGKSRPVLSAAACLGPVGRRGRRFRWRRQWRGGGVTGAHAGLAPFRAQVRSCSCHQEQTLVSGGASAPPSFGTGKRPSGTGLGALASTIRERGQGPIPAPKTSLLTTPETGAIIALYPKSPLSSITRPGQPGRSHRSSIVAVESLGIAFRQVREAFGVLSSCPGAIGVRAPRTSCRP
jgi:hypothetical protein